MNNFVALVFGLALTVPGLLAQSITCEDALGTPVTVIPTPALNDIGQASVYRGRPVIFFNAAFAQRFPSDVVTFFLYHECGHHALGHVLGAGFPLANEQAADCWAARTLVSQGKFDEDDIRTVQVAIAQFGRADWTHLPGPMRAMNLAGCLSGVGRARGTRSDTDDDDRTKRRQRGSDADDFGSVLRDIVRDAPRGFRSFRGRRDSDDTDDDTPTYDATRELPGNKGTCSVFGGSSPSYVCTMFRGDDEDDADSAYDQYVDESRSVFSNWRWSDVTRRSVEKGRQAVAPNGTTVRIEMTKRSGVYSVKVWVDGSQ